LNRYQTLAKLCLWVTCGKAQAERSTAALPSIAEGLGDGGKRRDGPSTVYRVMIAVHLFVGAPPLPGPR